MNDTQKEYLIENIKNSLFSNSTYYNNYNDKELCENIADFIRNNDSLIKTDDVASMCILKKIISKQMVMRELTTYEFMYYNPSKKYDDIHKLFNVGKIELEKYQGIVGGFNFEDSKWTICDTATRFKPKENQLCMYNSISKKDCRDIQLIWFIKTYVNHMKKFIDDKINIMIDYKIMEDENNNICWTIIVFEK